MITVRSPIAPSRPHPALDDESRGWWKAWCRFWFTPADPTGLHVVRLLSGILFLSWLLGFAGHQAELFGLHGWFDATAYREAARLPNGPPSPIGWSLVYLAGGDATRMALVYWTSVAILGLFTLGIAPRVTSILSYLVVASFTSNPVISYDGDALLVILAFYLMVGYVLQGQLNGEHSLLGRLFGGTSGWLIGRGQQRPSIAANLTLRLLQVHFCIVIFISGLHKLQSGDWWSGAALWYPLYPPFESTVAQVRAHMSHATFYLVVLSLATYLTLGWQIGFPLFAWRRSWRIVLLGGALVGWIATALVYRLPLFGPAYLIGCLCFLTPEEWQWLTNWLPRVPGLSQWLPAHATEAAPLVTRRDKTATVTAGRGR